MESWEEKRVRERKIEYEQTKFRTQLDIKDLLKEMNEKLNKLINLLEGEKNEMP